MIKLPCGSGEVFIFSVCNVLPGPVVPVLLGQTEVDHKQLVTMAPDPHQEVVWFDVPMDEILVVDVLDPPNHLVCQHEDGLHGKSPRAEVEEIFEARAKQVHHQHIVVALYTKPPNMRDTHASLKTSDKSVL